MGGADIKRVSAMQDNGIPLIPVTIDSGGLNHIYAPDTTVDLSNPQLPQGWTNFYRSDDVSATAYFYLASPSGNLPPLPGAALRTYKLAAAE